MTELQSVISKIKDLIILKGYIYALCMILFEDFHVNPEKLHVIDERKRVSTQEASLLLGFLIQNKIDFTLPDSPEDLIQMKKKTYELLDKLHKSHMQVFIDKLKDEFTKEHDIANYRKEQKEFFGKGDMLVEPIFYSGLGVYDFQYLEFIERKYKYDKERLLTNKKFDISGIQNMYFKIKSILGEKSKQVNLYDIKEREQKITQDMKKKHPNEDWDKFVSEILPKMEIYQYVKLFFDSEESMEGFDHAKIVESGWKSFYKNLINLFIVNKSDFGVDFNADSFLDNFAVALETGLNEHFQTVGDYNLIKSHPIIKLDSERYFVPIPFLLSEAVYESPFYWMLEDKKYFEESSRNRGKIGEELTYDFLSKVFESGSVFKSVKVQSLANEDSTKKRKDDTDIDVLCFLGNKALCVQVKSKKLTELARKGNDEQLGKDFNNAVQDAYEQGLISRDKILSKDSKFIDENGNEIYLPEAINEVYIMCITTENYPSLAHQSYVMLDKKDESPFPIVMTIFDLELVVHYLDDPYDFLYYIRQRIALMDYFRADEEMVFLGFHLSQKLWKIDGTDGEALDGSFGKIIDRNYYPMKAGISVSDEGDAIKNQWTNKDWHELLTNIKSLHVPQTTDIVFNLLDLCGETRDEIIKFMKETTEKTRQDGISHDFRIPMENFGVTFVSLNSNNIEELDRKLHYISDKGKYLLKASRWIGFGKLHNVSNNLIDVIMFSTAPWQFDEELETKYKGAKEGTLVNMHTGEKIYRKSPCSCGSGKKYKHCCGKEKN